MWPTHLLVHSFPLGQGWLCFALRRSRHMRVWGPSAWYDMKGISRIVYILVSKKNDLGSDLSTYLTLWWVYLFVSMYFVSGSRDGVDHLAHWNGTSTTNRAFTTSNSTWFDPRFLTPHVCVRGFSKRKKRTRIQKLAVFVSFRRGFPSVPSPLPCHFQLVPPMSGRCLFPDAGASPPGC